MTYNSNSNSNNSKHGNFNKLPDKYADPVDTFFLKSVEKISPFLKKNNVIPNQITTVSFIFGIISCILYYKENYIFSGIMYIISYYFDCVDGYYARRYNMTSVFGSYYDIISDQIVALSLVLLFIFNKKVNLKFKILTLVLFLIIYFITLLHMSCQEKYTEKNNKKYVSEGLQILKSIKCDNHNNMLYTRFVGTGMIVVIISIVIMLHKFIT
jgi:phosphatidylglycerophosphate synthase